MGTLHPSRWTRRRLGSGGLLSLFPCSQEPGRETWPQQKQWMCLRVQPRETNVEASLSIYLATRQTKWCMSQPQKGRSHHGWGGDGRRGDARGYGNLL
jgi:hypothetical protein